MCLHSSVIINTHPRDTETEKPERYWNRERDTDEMKWLFQHWVWMKWWNQNGGGFSVFLLLFNSWRLIKLSGQSWVQVTPHVIAKTVKITIETGFIFIHVPLTDKDAIIENVLNIMRPSLLNFQNISRTWIHVSFMLNRSIDELIYKDGDNYKSFQDML